MKRIAFALVALLLPALAAGQTAYSLFQPSNGVLKGSTSTYVTTPATSADIISLWTGTCSSTTFLRGDGQCLSPGGAGIGTVTSVGLDVSALGFNTTSSPIVSSGTFVVDGTLNVAHGGTGATTLTGLLEGTGTTALEPAESADVITLWTGTCSASTFLRGDGSCQSVPGTNDASTLTTGTLADARLTSNVPLKNASNIFTNNSSNTGALQVSTATPVYGWVETDVGTDEKRWREYAESTIWKLCALNDAESAENCALAIDRTGTAIADINITATAVRANGQAVLTATSALNATNVTSGTLPDARLSTNVVNYDDANPRFAIAGNNALQVVNNTTGFARVGIETNGIFRGDLCSSTTAGQCATGESPNDTALRFPQKLNLYDTTLNQIAGELVTGSSTRLGVRSTSGLATTSVVGVEFQASGGAALGYIGDSSSVNSDLVFLSNVGNINLQPAGGSAAQVSGSRINTVANSGKVAFGKVTASTGALTNSLNVTSVTRLQAGLFTINLTAAGFASNPACTVSTVAGNRPAGVSGASNTSVDVNVCDQAGNTCNLIDINFNFICHGL